MLSFYLALDTVESFKKKHKFLRKGFYYQYPLQIIEDMWQTQGCWSLAPISFNDSVVRRASSSVISQSKRNLKRTGRFSAVRAMHTHQQCIVWLSSSGSSAGTGRCVVASPGGLPGAAGPPAANSWAMCKSPTGGDIVQKLWVWIRTDSSARITLSCWKIPP